MREQILDILMDLRPDIDFESEKKLIDDHVLESFDIVSLVAGLEDEFDIKIRPKDLIAENFNSLDALTELVETLAED